jgi:hypothetical protein
LIVIIVDAAHKFEALVVNRISAKNFPVEVIGLLELLQYVPCARVLWGGGDLSLLKEFLSMESGFSPAGTVDFTVVVQIEGQRTFALAIPNCAMGLSGRGRNGVRFCRRVGDAGSICVADVVNLGDVVQRVASLITHGFGDFVRLCNVAQEIRRND